MRRVLLIVLLLTLPTFAQQVVQRGELTTRWEVRNKQDLPYLAVSFSNHSSRALSLQLPAGMHLIGDREPCLPVLLGKNLSVDIPPGKTIEVVAPAIRMSLYPHPPGTYHIAPRPMYDDEIVKAARTVYRIQQSQVRSDPLRLSQLAALYIIGYTPSEEIRKLATQAEWTELQSHLR